MAPGIDDPNVFESIDSTNLTYENLSRRETRSLVFHILYTIEAYDYSASVDSIVDMFNRGYGLDIPHDSEVVRIVTAIVEQREHLDETIKPYLVNWTFERLGVCTKLILRFAVWEILNTETPATVVINEAVELAKCFSEKDAYKFVNGILDELIKGMQK